MENKLSFSMLLLMDTSTRNEVVEGASCGLRDWPLQDEAVIANTASFGCFTKGDVVTRINQLDGSFIAHEHQEMQRVFCQKTNLVLQCATF